MSQSDCMSILSSVEGRLSNLPSSIYFGEDSWTRISFWARAELVRPDAHRGLVHNIYFIIYCATASPGLT